MNQLLSLQLWYLFKNAELTIFLKKKNNEIFVNALNNFCLTTVDENTEQILKIRFIDQFNRNFKDDALLMYAENAPTVLKS